MLFRTFASFVLCTILVQSVVLEFQPQGYAEDLSDSSSAGSRRSAPPAYGRDDVDAQIAHRYWREQRNILRDDEAYFRREYGVSRTKMIWRYQSHYIPVVKDAESGELVHVIDSETGEDKGVAYKRIWAYTLIEVSEDAPTETVRGKPDLPYEDEEPQQRFQVQPLPAAAAAAAAGNMDDDDAAWKYGVNLREADDIPAPADLPRLQGGAWGRVAAQGELAKPRERPVDDGLQYPGDISFVVVAEESVNPIADMVTQLLQGLYHLNPQDSTEFTAMVVDSDTGAQIRGGADPCDFDDEVFENSGKAGPVFVLRGRISKGKVNVKLMLGRSHFVEENSQWESEVAACALAFRNYGLQLGLRSMGFSGETPDPENEGGLDSLKYTLLQHLRASVWMSPDRPIGVKVFLWKENSVGGNAWKSSSFILQDGHDDTLAAFADSLVQAVAATEHISVELLYTAADLRQIVQGQ